MDERSLEGLERDKQRYDQALRVLRSPQSTVFSLVLLPERLLIAETQSAMDGLGKLGIGVQSLVINQAIEPEVIEGNRFLAARAALQAGYLKEIDACFGDLVRSRLPLFDHDTAFFPTKEVFTIVWKEAV